MNTKFIFIVFFFASGLRFKISEFWEIPYENALRLAQDIHANSRRIGLDVQFVNVTPSDGNCFY